MEEFTYLFKMFLKICFSILFIFMAYIGVSNSVQSIKYAKHNIYHRPIDNTIFCVFMFIMILSFAIWMTTGVYYIWSTESVNEFLSKFVFWKGYNYD